MSDPTGKPRANRTVCCITGDSGVCGTSVSLVKRHYRSLKNNPLPLVSPEVMEFESLEFSSEEASNLSHPHHDALVISIFISNSLIKCTLIDNGVPLMLFLLVCTLKNIQILNSEIVRKVTTLIGFSSEPKQTLGEILLLVFVEGINTVTKFQVVDTPSTYNVILGRP